MLIDSNIIIYAINADSPKCKRAQELLKQNTNLQITEQNILEALKVLTHSKFSSPMKTEDAITAITNITDALTVITPNLTSLYLALTLIGTNNLSGNRIFDAYLAATALSNGIDTIATDNVKDFEKFEGIKIINPF